MRIYFLLTAFGLRALQAVGQQHDSAMVEELDSVIVRGYLRQSLQQSLPDIQGTYIFSGKKSEMISLQQATADLSNKIGRQVFAKVPGVFVYDMDGSGNQINISTRGLDPHRGWELNLRKDGIVTNSDMYGYPASHYSMPLESIDHIELVHGTGALQYGAQFGGMLNYVSKQGDTSRPFSFESINTIGSYNLVSTFNAIGGKIGKFKYYAYITKKVHDGYRDNEHTSSDAENIALTWEPSSKFSVKMEWARSQYQYRIPGPLTDSMFYADPTQSTRSRNYFSPDIHVPSVVLNWQMTRAAKIQLTSSAVLGNRSSVQYDKPTNIPDTINPITLQYNNRQVDIDRFHSYTTELRIIQQYRLGRYTSSLVTGLQYMNNDLHRSQLGVGTTGSDYDLSLVVPGFGRDLHFKTQNLAAFAENHFQLTRNFSVNLGLRAESGASDLTGKIVYYPDDKVPVNISHHFPLFGASFSWRPMQRMELYGGFSQAYRSMALKDLIPSSTYEKLDPNIRDAKGYNAEIGFRGNWQFLRWDITAYLLQYNNRFGTLAQTDASGALYLYRTNIGNSLTSGLEIFVEAAWMLGSKTSFSVFSSTAVTHARYTDAAVKSGNVNADIRGNKVESAPDFITRNGATFGISRFKISALFSYTSDSYADPLNTVKPAPTTGAVGLVPAYALLDMNASYRISSKLELKFNVSNLANHQYFTKRPTFYPGPGVWPSDGRNMNGSVIIKL